MPRSMTAFGRARVQNAAGDRDVTVEIKSVNSRFLDLTVKLPRYISYLEMFLICSTSSDNPTIFIVQLL